MYIHIHILHGGVRVSTCIYTYTYCMVWGSYITTSVHYIYKFPSTPTHTTPTTHPHTQRVATCTATLVMSEWVTGSRVNRTVRLELETDSDRGRGASRQNDTRTRAAELLNTPLPTNTCEQHSHVSTHIVLSHEIKEFDKLLYNL